MTELYTREELLALPTGTPVVCISGYGEFKVGNTLYREYSVGDDIGSVKFNSKEDFTGVSNFMTCNEVAKINPKHAHKLTSDKPLGMFRPDIETRKVGKTRVELVDDGFPLALREVAKVMTWAQTAKGYKDHDWQNLPDAEVQLAAAASRHRTDMIKQRVVEGLPIEECVDPESGIIHKAHEAFGVLAQLELMLRGNFVDSRKQSGV